MNARRRRWHFPIVFSQISSSFTCFSFSFFLRDLCHHLRFSFHFRDCTWITRDEMCAVRLQWRKTPSRNLIYPFIYFYGQVEREKKKRPPCVTQSPFSVCVFCPRISKKGKQKKVASSNFGHAHSRRCRHAKNPKKKRRRRRRRKMENGKQNGAMEELCVYSALRPKKLSISNSAAAATTVADSQQNCNKKNRHQHRHIIFYSLMLNSLTYCNIFRHLDRRPPELFNPMIFSAYSIMFAAKFVGRDFLVVFVLDSLADQSTIEEVGRTNVAAAPKSRRTFNPQVVIHKTYYTISTVSKLLSFWRDDVTFSPGVVGQHF